MYSGHLFTDLCLQMYVRQQWESQICLTIAVVRHDMRMTEDEVDSCLHQSCENLGSEDSAVNDSRPLKSYFVDANIYKEQKDAIKLPKVSRDPEAEVNFFQPRPPIVPRLSKARKSVSVDETTRTRRLRNSQESLSDPAETGSSTDSLKEDQTTSTPGGFIHSTAAISRNDQASTVRPLSAAVTGSPLLQDGLSEYETRPRSQQSDSTEHRARSSRVHLSPVQSMGPLPVLEKNFASATLKTANLIDRDCLDDGTLARERLQRNLSDSRLLENMGFDSASVNSMKSTYSVLSPIRPQDVRNRYWSFRWPISAVAGVLLSLDVKVI